MAFANNSYTSVINPVVDSLFYQKIEDLKLNPHPQEVLTTQNKVPLQTQNGEFLTTQGT